MIYLKGKSITTRINKESNMHKNFHNLENSCPIYTMIYKIKNQLKKLKFNKIK